MQRRGAELDAVLPDGGMPDGGMPGGGMAGAVAAGVLPRGLDWQALLEALAASGVLDGRADEQEAVLAEERAAAAEGRMGKADPAQVAALAVEYMDPGPALAGWLEVAAAASARLDEHALAGVAMASRRQAARAQAAELAAVAQITARAAAADPRIGVRHDGRPARLCRDALGQISLALTLNDYRAVSRADLAITLTWRLPDTGAALAAGRIDADRAQAIAGATAVLDEETARAVEAKLLPGAGGLTVPDLKDRLRKAVRKADPQGAEERRRAAERHADVRLHADEDQTASIVADKMPQIETAAGYARVTALARARKAAGLPGSLGEHRAAVLLGLILGTLPWIPPADGAPPDQPPPPDNGGPGHNDPGHNTPRNNSSRNDPHDHTPRNGADRNRPGPGHNTSRDDPGRDDPGRDDPGRNNSGRNDAGRDASGDGARDVVPAPRDEDAPEDDGLDDQVPDDDGLDDDSVDDLTGTGPGPQWPELGTIPAALARRAGPAKTRPGHRQRHDEDHGQAGAEDNDQAEDPRPMPGLLEISLPWTVLAGLSDDPGTLGRIGPVTAVQARRLAQAAAGDPAAQWRIVITSNAGQAIAVTRIRRRTRDGPAPPADHHATQWPTTPARGLVGRITLTISQQTLASVTKTGPPKTGPPGPARNEPPDETNPSGGTQPPDKISPVPGTGPPGKDASPAETQPPDKISPATGGSSLSEIADAALRAAVTALDQALAQAAEDAAASGCAHGPESKAYRPPPRLRDFIAARDLTCRFPTCRMPAWRGDLDHTIPWDQGGRTCSCNLGGGCRGHHQLKQHPRWRLKQRKPGEFTWITPAGRTYTVRPDSHLA